MFITFEGPDGSGKSTQARLIADYLKMRGYAVLLTREPGGTNIGEQIRNVLLSTRNALIRHETEALLFSAARAQIVAEVIRPALAAGQIVICDRFADSTLAYQGYGLGLDLEALRTITRFATGGLVPDVTFYIDLSAQDGLARKRRGRVNRLDQKEIAYHERVHAGFLEMVKAEPSRWIVVNGMQSVDEIQGEIRAWMEQKLEGK